MLEKEDWDANEPDTDDDGGEWEADEDEDGDVGEEGDDEAPDAEEATDEEAAEEEDKGPDEEADEDEPPEKEKKRRPLDPKRKAEKTAKRVQDLLKARREAERRAWETERKMQEAIAERDQVLAETAQYRLKALEERRAQMRRELAQAHENGDTEQFLTLQDEIAKLDYDRRTAEHQVRQYQGPQGTEGEQQQRPPPPPHFIAWQRRVGLDKWTEAEKNRVHIIDAELMSEGYNPNSMTYLVEAEKRLRPLVPKRFENLDELYDPDAPEEPEAIPELPTRRRSGRPVSPVSGGDRRVKGNVKHGLTTADIQNMRAGGWDPNSPADRAKFLRGMNAGR